MIQVYDIKEYRQTHPFTGADLANIVKSDDLEGFDLFEYNKEFIDIQSMAQYINKWTYVVRFRRLVK